MRLRQLACAAASMTLLVGAGLPQTAAAQRMALPSIFSAEAQPFGAGGGMGFFSVGWQRLDLGDLNPRLEAAGYPAFAEDFLSLGGSGYFVRQRVIIGGEGNGLLRPSETTADGAFRTRLSGGYGMFNLGYALASSPRAALFPMVGIGGGGVVLEILDRATPNFDDVLLNPQRGARLTSGGLMLDASAGVTYRLTEPPPRRPRRGSGGLALGLRAGYTFAPFTTEWRTDAGNDVAAGPDVSLQGAYVRVMLGGWGGGRRR